MGTIGAAAVLITGLVTIAFALSGLSGLGKDVRVASDANAPSFHQIRNEYVLNTDPERELYLRGAWQKAEQKAATAQAAELRREAAEAEAALSAAQAAAAAAAGETPYVDEFGHHGGPAAGQQTPAPTPSATYPKSEL